MGLFSRRDRTPATRAGTALEHRDPTAATRALRWTTPGRAQAPDWDASQAFERAYYSNVVVYACYQAIAATISALHFRVGANPDNPHDFDVEAPLARLLGPPPGGPNTGMSAGELWFFGIIQQLVTGRLGWEIETGQGSDVPVALWPLVSSALVPVPSLSGTGWWSGFEYGRRDQAKTMRPDQVFYAWTPRGSDFRQPESALEAAHLDINVAVMQSQYDFAFLKNDARPAALVVTEAFASQEDFEAFKAQWGSEYGGPRNAGRVGFVEAEGGGDKGVAGAVDVKVLGISPHDAENAVRHAAAMQRIAVGLGVPWSRLDASGRTFANASEEDRIWWQQRLLPLIRRLESAVNIQLAPRLGQNVGWFDLRKIRALQERPDPVSTPVGAQVLVQAQIFTINEARADYGLPPLADGDRMMTAAEIQAISGAGQPAPIRLVLGAEERALHDYKGDGGPCVICGKPAVHQSHGYFMPRSADDAPAPLVLEAAPVEDRGPTPEEIEARRAKVWHATDSTVRNLERSWERALRRLFTRQLRSAIARLEGKKGRALHRSHLTAGETGAPEARAFIGEIFDVDHWTAETADETRALYEQVTAAGGARVSDLFGIAFDIEAPYAQEFIQARANLLAGQISDTTYRAIVDVLAAGVAEGEGIPELADRIRAVFDTATTSRATTIARTEVISAYNGSATAVAAQLPSDVAAGQEWIAARDGRTREWHAERDGEIVAIGARFSGGMAYPGDPAGGPDETVNCRCTVAFLTPKEFTAEGGRSRMVDRRVAATAIAMVTPGVFDERAFRKALVAA